MYLLIVKSSFTEPISAGKIECTTLIKQIIKQTDASSP